MADPKSLKVGQGNVVRDEDFYAYTVNSGSLAAGGTATVQIPIEADTEFALVKMTQFSDIAGAAQTEDSRVLPLVTIQITDGSNSRALLSNPTAIPALFGDGKIPYILPIQRRFRPNSVITLSFVNFSAATTYPNVRITLHGIKRWY